ncbi:hypothetical protein SAMN05518861_12168 [Mesorhizobium sp. YR577]|nr:hypothetical protein SAMN05518861_12168 [Mesorhizobium sp. YR577]
MLLRYEIVAFDAVAYRNHRIRIGSRDPLRKGGRAVRSAVANSNTGDTMARQRERDASRRSAGARQIDATSRDRMPCQLKTGDHPLPIELRPFKTTVRELANRVDCADFACLHRHHINQFRYGLLVG